MKTQSITLRISQKEKERLVAIAAKRDIPLSQLIREILKKGLEEEE